MPKMKADEFSLEEHLRAKLVSAAKEGYANMNMNEYQLIYFSYILFLLKKNPNGNKNYFIIDAGNIS